ncbi:TPA: pentapeptide repeat-containing protein, partial [Candidatus Uhrbacteria bacterium]|nr:pentapeptide repeat-containing protein [Candidatus Uhrbacteria bacterium]
GVKLVDCGLRQVRFVRSKLLGVDFTRCTINFFALSFDDCLVESCNFSGLPMKGTKFLDSIVRECVFGRTNLSKSSFERTDLSDSVFHDANLSEADFSRAKNYAICPTTNKVAKAKFSLPEAVSLLRGLDIELE